MNIDKETVGKRFAKSLLTYHHHASVQKQMAEMLVSLALPHLHSCETVFEVGCGSGLLTSQVLEHTHPANLIVNDLVGDVAAGIEELLRNYPGVKFSFVYGDAEVLAFPEVCNVIWSGAVLQWFHRPDLFFRKAAQSLSDDGIIAFSTFGPDNFHEVVTTTGSGLQYQTMADTTELLKDDFEILESVQYRKTIWFEQPIDVLRHIKATGVGGVSKQMWCKRQLNDFVDAYQQFFVAGKGYALTYHPVLVVGRKKAAGH
jgi:malonyl-ACP O-methyltransferase BioC